MAQHDYIIGNAAGALARADINAALAACVSNNSGASEPATTYAGQWWLDTDGGALKLRTLDNLAWTTALRIVGSDLVMDGGAW